MTGISRRRALTILAAATVLPAAAQSQAHLPLHTWQGRALGGRATLRLAHPDAKAIARRMAAEIDRLEGIFSLFRLDSALSQLNRAGHLDAPPFELLRCLSLAGRMNEVTGGRFDPTIQPLWRVYSEAARAGRSPRAEDLRHARDVAGWDGVTIASDRITLRPGMGLTLNGIAQGMIADRIADLLAALGLDHVLIDTGELRALGGMPEGSAWPVQLAAGGTVPLRARALATSAPQGTTFGPGRTGASHILDPERGVPVASPWREVTVSARSAALADALSTAACLCGSRDDMQYLVAQFPDARLEAVSTASG